MYKKSSRELDVSAETRTDVVIEVLAGEMTLAQAAARCGATVEDVATWRDIYLDAGRRHERQAATLEHLASMCPRSLFRRIGARVAIGAVAFAAMLLIGGKVVADRFPGCVLEPDFACFAAKTPARASDVNKNFAKVVDWIEQKLGPVGSADVVFPGTIGTGSGVAIALTPGGRITGVDRIVGAAGLVLRGATANADDLTVGADGMVTIPDLTVTNSLAIPGGLPITIESQVSKEFTVGTPPQELGDSTANRRVCFITRIQHAFNDNPIAMPHQFNCRVRISEGKWVLEGEVTIAPTETLTCAARCISW